MESKKLRLSNIFLEPVMPRNALPHLEAALAAANKYVRASIRARDRQYQFLAASYRAYIEGQGKPRQYAEKLAAILRRPPTRPEAKRPFLHLLHAVIGSEDDAPRNALPQFSKLASALEEIQRAFADTDPSVKEVIEYIQDAGGVSGLYDLSRLVTTDHGARTSRDADADATIRPIPPGEIRISAIGAHVTKVGRGYRLRLSDWQPGEYLVRLQVGPGGFLEAILDQELNEQVA